MKRTTITIIKYAFFSSLLGYFIFHPLSHIVLEIIHIHEETTYHLHFSKMLFVFFESFKLKYFPHQILFSLVFCALGSTIGIYRSYELVTQESNKRFSLIGLKASQILHDLSNPLAVISMKSELLSLEVDHPEVEDFIKVFNSQNDRILNMIEDVKDIAKGKSLKKFYNELDLKVFANENLSLSFDKINLICNLDEEIKIFADPNLLERVMKNLINNAKDAISNTKDPNIEIHLFKNKNDALIKISDNGQGIPKKLLKKLFKPLNTYGKKSGTGLGLYTCKEIINDFGGDIKIKSKEGSGTQVFISFPLVKN